LPLKKEAHSSNCAWLILSPVVTTKLNVSSQAETLDSSEAADIVIRAEKRDDELELTVYDSE